MKKISLFLVSVIGLMFMANLYADTATKIGVVDVQKVLANSSQVKNMKESLQKQFTSDRNVLQAKQKNLENLMEKYKRDSAVMKKTDREKMEEKINASRNEFVKSSQEYQQKLTAAQQDALEKIVERLQNVSAKVAKKNGMSIVLPKANILYSDDNFDITSDVMKIMR
jgi:outer membrane protein